MTKKLATLITATVLALAAVGHSAPAVAKTPNDVQARSSWG